MDFQNVVTGGLKLTEPASSDSIKDAEKKLGVKLPGDYKNFLKKSNGAKGSIGKFFLVLWPIQDLDRLNQEYQVEKFYPGLLFFGSNGGGEAYAFNTEKAGMPIIRVPFIGRLEDAENCGKSFDDFLRVLAGNSGKNAIKKTINKS